MAAFLSGLKSAVSSDPGGSMNPLMASVMENPTIKKLTNAAGKIGEVGTKIQDLTGNVKELPNKVAEVAGAAATAKVNEALAAQGMEPAAPSSNSSGAEEGEINAEEGENNAEEENNAEQEGGGPRYEIVELTTPIKDPLFVYYMNGKAIYFTQNARGHVVILPMLSDLESIREYLPHKYTKKTTTTHKRGSTKKTFVKGARKLTRKSGQRRSRRS
jgi:outer membrane murein-binding lipoprotein Lpp